MQRFYFGNIDEVTRCFGVLGLLCYTVIARFSLSRGVRINLTRQGQDCSARATETAALSPSPRPSSSDFGALTRDVFVCAMCNIVLGVRFDS